MPPVGAVSPLSIPFNYGSANASDARQMQVLSYSKGAKGGGFMSVGQSITTGTKTPRKNLDSRGKNRQICALGEKTRVIAHLCRDPALPVELGESNSAQSVAKISMHDYDRDIRDWRKLKPGEWLAHFESAKSRLSGLGGLTTAITCGTLQACLQGSYWAPYFGHPEAVQVDCSHLKFPTSRLYPPEQKPDPASMEIRYGGPQFSCFKECHPLDVCKRMTSDSNHKHFAVVHFTGMNMMNDFTASSYGSITPCLANYREEQLFLRTSYYQAFENMQRQIHTPLKDAIESGGLVYTPDVAVFRGPVEEGAEWLPKYPRTDVLWAGVQRHPKMEQQGQYGIPEEKEKMQGVVDRIFAWAASHEVDVLVLPPLGCGTHGCAHPSLDVADIIHKAAMKYGKQIGEVVMASDHPAHFQGDWWLHFSSAFQYGRPPVVQQEYVPIDSILPFVRKKKNAEDLKAKEAKAKANPPRVMTRTFL